jgi:hypothetical protein
MVNRLFHRIAAVTLAVLMMVSTTGFSMDAHYCQNQLQGVSFLGKAKNCHEKRTTSPCHKAKTACHHQLDDTNNPENNDCCQNKKVVIDKIDADATSPQAPVLQDISLHFVTAFITTYLIGYPIQIKVETPHLYKPPIPDRDVLAILQTYLI